MQPGEIDEALEVRRLILPRVAHAAFQYAQGFDYNRMREEIAFGVAALPRGSANSISADRVHSTIIATMRFDLALDRATRNSLIVRMELLLHWVEPLRRKTLHNPADFALAIELIQRMLEAVERGDQKIAEISERRLVILETALKERTGRRIRRRHTAL